MKDGYNENFFRLVLAATANPWLASRADTKQELAESIIRLAEEIFMQLGAKP